MPPTIYGEIVDKPMTQEVRERIKKLQLLVGNTPMLRFDCQIDNKRVKIYAKYEAWNFTGSIKDRMALEIIKAAYDLGTLSESVF